MFRPYRNVPVLALTAALTLLVAPLSAEVPFFSWIKPSGGFRPSSAFGVATDGLGNTYLAGSFGTTGTNGLIDFGSTNFTSAGGIDGFLAKYNSAGDCLWARRIGGADTDEAIKVATSSAGDVCVLGEFTSTAQIGSSNIISGGGIDVFIARFSAAGDLQWVRSAGGVTNDTAGSTAVDLVGNCYITGGFAGPASVGNTNLLTQGESDGFLAKFAADGSFAWVVAATGPGAELGRDLAVDRLGRCYWAGKFTQATSFGGTNIAPSAGAASAVFIARHSTSGALEWVRPLGQGPDAQFPTIAIDPTGYVYVTAHYSGSYQVDGFSVPSGVADVVFARFNNQGQASWVRTFGGVAADVCVDTKVDDFGNSYLGGHFRGTSSIGTNTLTSAGSSDVLVVSYDSSGRVRWVKKAGGSNSDIGLALALDGSSRLYVAGAFNGTATFGNSTVTSPDLLQKAFLARMELAPTLTISGDASQVRLSWPTNFHSFTVESSPAEEPFSWTMVTNAVSIVDAQFTMTDNAPLRSKLFRLRSN